MGLTLLPGERPASRHHSAARRIGRVLARPRLESELRSIAMDLLGPNGTDGLSPRCAVWVTATTHAAAAEACDRALGALVEALDMALIDVPPEITRQLDRARVRHDAGFA
jgi:hypothetical protein